MTKALRHQASEMEITTSMRRVMRLPCSALSGCVLLLALTVLLVAWALRSSAPKPLLLTDAQLAALRLDPHVAYYVGTRYKELPSGSVLRRLPRHMAFGILSAYFCVAQDDYAQTVARHLPVRVSETPPTVVSGLHVAADHLFQCQIQDIPVKHIELLMDYGKAPLRFPVIAISPNEKNSFPTGMLGKNATP